MFSSKLRGFGLFLFHLISNQYLEAVPVPTSQIQQVPWAQPCTPGITGARRLAVPENRTLATVDLNTDENVASVKTKTEEAIQCGEILQQNLMDMFEDQAICGIIQTRNLFGFPQVIHENESHNQSVGSRFRKVFTQLSQAAVFLDRNRRIQKGDEHKEQLNILISDNLSLMCEMQIILPKFGLSEPEPANRSIMGRLPESISTFNRNVLFLNTIFKYKALLTSHLTWYRRIITTAN